MAPYIHTLPQTIAILSLMVLIFFTTFVKGRILKINSSDDLISDGIDHVDSQYPALTVNGYLLSASTCQHTYGFLPCAENAGGYIFQLPVYQGLLIFGEWQLSKGSKWGICLIVGASKLGQKSRPDHSESPASCCLRVIEKLTELNDTGIKIDDKTRYTAGIMLLSLIP
ncbi:Calcium-binding EF-hand family protein [Abeliophyllum distichum]|uniref:Calcium-binding EF-hand family protein n=1 Tax=Abeliophyllum distichum TaxID=126358 RepID=A0ABD1QGA4_9LAMI